MINQQYKDLIINALADEVTNLRALNESLRASVRQLQNRLAPYEKAMRDSTIASYASTPTQDMCAPCPSNES